MPTLFLITARGGSKGVTRKNLRRIGGKSLIEWKVAAARPTMRDGDSMILSTEDTDIAAEATRLGVTVLPRPLELATDSASSSSVVAHALDTVGEGFDQVMLLEPSSPFAAAVHYGMALAMIGLHNADAVIGMRKVAPHSTFVGEIPENNSIGQIVQKMRLVSGWRRQDFKDEWTASGALYLFRTEMFKRTGSIYGGDNNVGFLMPHWNSIEIDTLEDLALAEFAVDRGFVG